MLVKELGGLLILAFIVWIFLAPQPDVRMQRACSPVQWGGNVVTSLAALSTPAAELYVQTGMDKMTYGCEYSLWRLFYQKQYNQYQLYRAAHPGTAATQSTAVQTTAPVSSAASAQAPRPAA